jgi:hypothetical protein
MNLHPAEPAKPFSNGEFFTATAEWSGRDFSARTKSGVTMALARELVTAGCPDQEWQAKRSGGVALFGRSLHCLSLLTVNEGDKGKARFAQYHPHTLARAA